MATKKHDEEAAATDAAAPDEATADAADGKKLDETIPGGLYRNADGSYKNANGDPVTKTGKPIKTDE